jgi:uncharacterized membrane protein
LWAVALHVLAATLWIGGMLFFAVAAPVLRSIEDDALRARLFDTMGRRFRLVGWVCVSVLIASGLVQLRLRGWWGGGFWNRSALFGTPVGVMLLWKLALVAIMVAVQAVHDFWLGPRAGAVVPGSEPARVARKRAAGLARFNAAVALLLVYVAVRLGRGG